MERTLVIDDVSKSFAEFRAVDRVKAFVLPQRVTAFIGPNGAGKTTLFHLVCGTLRPDSGRIRLRDRDITGLAPWRIARLGLGRLFQDVRVFSEMSVAENVVAALLSERESSPVWGLADCLCLRRTGKRHMEEALHWLAYVGLADRRADCAGALSFGQQKLLAMARLLAQGCDLLLLDEPTAALSPAMTEQMASLIRKLVTERHITVAIIEHNMSVVASLADWIFFMNEGRVAFAGRTDHVLGNAEVRETYMGLRVTSAA